MRRRGALIHVDRRVADHVVDHLFLYLGPARQFTEQVVPAVIRLHPRDVQGFADPLGDTLAGADERSRLSPARCIQLWSWRDGWSASGGRELAARRETDPIRTSRSALCGNRQ